MLHDMQSSIKPLSWFGVLLHCRGPGTIWKLLIAQLCALTGNRISLTWRKTLTPTSPFTCHLAEVMSDLCQEGPDNDVTTGSRKSAGISKPSGVLWTNQIHKNGNIDIWDKIMALARLAT